MRFLRWINYVEQVLIPAKAEQVQNTTARQRVQCELMEINLPLLCKMYSHQLSEQRTSKKNLTVSKFHFLVPLQSVSALTMFCYPFVLGY